MLSMSPSAATLYDPRLMLKLLIYGYATGTPSSRKLEQASYRDGHDGRSCDRVLVR